MTDTVTIRRELLEELRDSANEATNYSQSARERSYHECVVALADAALAAPVQGEAEPFAVTTGYFGGHATIRPINPATVINPGLALYTTPPQPANFEELVEALKWISRVNATDYEYQKVARAALAKLEGK